MATILIIEDDNQLRGLLKQMLERGNYQVIEAPDAEQGMELSIANSPDLVISDLILPGKDGLMAIQELLAQNPRLKIIAMSGGATGNAAWLPIAKKAGAIRVLKKPFGQKQLIETIGETLAAV